MTFHTSMEFPNFPVDRAFDRFTKEIAETLRRKGVIANLQPSGKLEVSSKVVSQVTEWDPPRSFSLQWWQPETRGKEYVTTLKVFFEAVEQKNGTRVVIEHEGWAELLGNTHADPIDWFVDVVAGPLLAAATPDEYGEWLINRVARKPSGTVSKEHYAKPVYHIPNFECILETLKLNKDDYLLEVGCGGGYLLAEAMKSGCRAEAVDHSPDMLEVAKDQNSKSIEEGKLNLYEGDAGALPFSQELFTCAVSTGVLHFLSNPSAFFSEVHRVLKKSGRLVLFVGSKKILGTPAVPDPISNNFLRFYDDEELHNLASQAGFTDIRIEHPDQKEFAIRAGVPEEHLYLFSDPSFGQMLVAYK